MSDRNIVPSSSPSQILSGVFDGHRLRVVLYEGKPWFVAKDVASALGYANTTQAVLAHCKRAKSLNDIGVWKSDPYTNQELDPQTKIIPEPDIYRLTVSSHLPSAVAFEEWLFEVLIPAIREGEAGQLAPVPDQAALVDPRYLELGRLHAEHQEINRKKEQDLDAVKGGEETARNTIALWEDYLRKLQDYQKEVIDKAEKDRAKNHFARLELYQQLFGNDLFEPWQPPPLPEVKNLFRFP